MTTLALPAALALALAACETDGGEVTSDEPAAPAPDEGTDVDQDDAVALPTGMFGDECQRILAEAELDGAGTQPTDDTDVDEEAGSDDAGETEDTAGTEDTVAGDVEGETTDVQGQADELRTMDTLAVLQALPEFAPLVSAAQTSGFAAQLEGTSQLTVFAPTFDAFSSLDDPRQQDATAGDQDEAGGDQDGAAGDEAGAPNASAAPQLDDVDELLSYHVLDGQALDAQSLADQGTIDSMGQQQLTVAASSADQLTVEFDGVTANVVCANIETSDGFVHVVDQVLLPQAWGQTDDTDAGFETETGRDDASLLDDGTDDGTGATTDNGGTTGTDG